MSPDWKNVRIEKGVKLRAATAIVASDREALSAIDAAPISSPDSASITENPEISDDMHP